MPQEQDRVGPLRRVRPALQHPLARAAIALVGVLAGAAIVMLTMAVGHCGFMGGLCPAAPGPWWRDDVFGTAAAGLGLAVTAPLLAWHPSRRGFAMATVAVVAVLPVAWLLAEFLRTGGS